MSASLEIFSIDIYNKDKKIMPKFMLAFLFLYFCRVIYGINRITANI